MLTGVLATLCTVFVLTSVAAAIAWKKAHSQLGECKAELGTCSTELDRYSQISNIDAYKQESELATVEAKRTYEKHVAATESLRSQEQYLKGELKELRELIGEFKSANELREHVGSLDVKKNAIKKQIRGYQRIVADFKSAADLGNHVENLRKLVGDFKNANEIQAHTKVLDDQVVGKKKLLAAYSDAIEDARTAQEIKAKSVYYTNLVAQLEEDLEELTEAKQLQEFAFYRPRFDFEKSAEYRQRLDENRAKQKDLLKSESATHCEIEWEVSGNAPRLIVGCPS